MILRIRSAKGQLRLDLGNDASTVTMGDLRSRIARDLQMSADQPFVISNQPDGSRPFANDSKALQALGVKHGDLLYVTYDRSRELQEATSTSAVGVTPPLAGASETNVKEETVDIQLQQMDGLIRRGKDADFCRHGPNAMCDYCMPLEPYDAAYLERQKIKHMSFHAYIRKITAANKNAAKASHVSMPPPLEEPSFAVKTPCDSGHAPYPASMCAKCQPSAIVLQQQPFRMVDHVEFECAAMVDQFLAYWRQSGLQRFGYLYGRWEVHGDVPLGIKAVVAAIYEPAQRSAVDGVELDKHDPHGKSVDELAASLGLVKIGQIYTDLIDDGTGTGKVLCRRYGDTFFVSSAECVFIAGAQLNHPNPCRYSASGKYGSKFITVVVSGDKENNIHLSAYQVSTTAEALVRDQIVDATTNPGMMRVQSSTPSHYVPELFYKFRNKYGVMVQEAAAPTFPVEYFLVTLTEGFPQQPNPFFTAAKTPFPVGNRGGLAHQDMTTVREHLSRNDKDIISALRDFHFLVFLKSTGVFQDSDWAQLAETVKLNDRKEVERRLASNGSWQTLLMIAKEAVGSQTMPSAGGSSASASSTRPDWTCRHCTYNNGGSRGDCEMCGLPKE